MSKQETLKKRQKQNTGSPTYQILTFTQRIQNLSQHIQQNKKDTTAKRGIHTLVCKRKRMLKYLQRQDPQQHQQVKATHLKKK